MRQKESPPGNFKNQSRPNQPNEKATKRTLQDSAVLLFCSFFVCLGSPVPSSLPCYSEVEKVPKKGETHYPKPTPLLSSSSSSSPEIELTRLTD